MPREQSVRQSKYNAAVAELYRLDALWQSCHHNKRHGRLTSWNHDLDCIWAELAADADQKKDYIKFKYFSKLIIENRKNLVYLNQILMNKHIFLKKLQNAQGKGTAYADPYEDDFD